MSRRTDLEQYIRESYDLVCQYEDQIRLSDRPKEKARSKRDKEEQWNLIHNSLADQSGPMVPICLPNAGWRRTRAVTIGPRKGGSNRKLGFPE